MNHLFKLLDQLTISKLDDVYLPHYLLGCFKRKNITFFNGLTDEKTIVYWFQSRSFSIDLRLNDAQETPITERQGWIGTTLWDQKTQLLSWDIQQSYQTRVQWPEPAKLYPIGNCILEFAPSQAYVEDWRQQANTGLLLGLRLKHIENIKTNSCIPMDGGFIISGPFMAYVQSRFPHIHQKCQNHHNLQKALQNQQLSIKEISQYETSISLNNGIITYSTCDDQVGQTIDLNNFEQLTNGALRQYKFINGTEYFFYYDLDFYLPNFNFSTQSLTSDFAKQWVEQEQQHLFRHAHTVV